MKTTKKKITPPRTPVLGVAIVTPDRRLGRLVEFDTKSLHYGIRELLPAYKPRSYTWSCAQTLDQGQEGSCVGHAWAHELIARPDPVKGVTHQTALDIYKMAQTLDPWPGENYSGTSVLAGIKALQALYPASATSYRFAFGIEDVVQTIGYFGPLVFGINWMSGMYSPDANGVIHATGEVVGGHAILARAVNIKTKMITLRNSWGLGWGNKGDCLISFDDVAKLLAASGEAVVPLGRNLVSV